MPQTLVEQGESLAALADRVLGDPTRFGELLDINPNLDVFGDLVAGQLIELPELQQVLNMASPRLGRIAQTLNGQQISSTIEQARQLQGYVSSAIDQLQQINNIGDAIEIVEDVEAQVRSGARDLVAITPWLLGGR